MPRACSICTHPDREAIDAALTGGDALRNIAPRFGTSTTALHRHKHEHLLRGAIPDQEPADAAVVSQESPTSTLPPEVQKTVAEYQKATAILDALRTLTEQDWQHWERWEVLPEQVMLPLSLWEAELYVQLWALGINPIAVTLWGEAAALSQWRAAATRARF
jgi:transposase-like protein